jgi:hypothetical protein
MFASARELSVRVFDDDLRRSLTVSRRRVSGGEEVRPLGKISPGAFYPKWCNLLF